MPARVQIYDREAGEVLDRLGADAVEILRNTERFTRDIPPPDDRKPAVPAKEKKA